MSLLEGNDAIRTVMTSPGRSGARALSVVSSTTSTQQAHDKHTTSTQQAHTGSPHQAACSASVQPAPARSSARMQDQS